MVCRMHLTGAVVLILLLGRGCQAQFEAGDNASTPILDVNETTVTTTAELVVEKRSGELVLYAHLGLMTLAWGACLPCGVAVANRLKNVSGATKGAWLKLHVRFQIIGWLLSLLGLGAAIWYCEFYASHLGSLHALVGAGVVAVGELQPLSAAFRPHPSEPQPCARMAFVVVHKIVGLLAVLIGMAVVWIGIFLVRERGYDDFVVLTAGGLAVLCMTPVVAFFVLAALCPDNKVSKWLTGASAAVPVRPKGEFANDATCEELQHHSYEVTTLTKPTWCHSCRGFLWGLTNQGSHCTRCHAVVCARCAAEKQPCAKAPRKASDKGEQVKDGMLV